MGRSTRQDRNEARRAGMLAVADRLFTEFPHLPFLTIAETMNAVRRQSPGKLEDPDPDTVYRLARPRLAEAGHD